MKMFMEKVIGQAPSIINKYNLFPIYVINEIYFKSSQNKWPKDSKETAADNNSLQVTSIHEAVTIVIDSFGDNVYSFLDRRLEC